MNQIKRGYKAVVSTKEFRWFIAELEIPDDAQVIHTDFNYYRTDKVIPRCFYTGEHTVHSASQARSWFNRDFKYKLNSLLTSELNMNKQLNCAAGIHFFETFEQAVCWGVINVGREG